MTVTQTARAAADRAENLANVLRDRAAAHPAAAVLLKMASRLDTAARAFATEPAPVLDGITVTNTVPFEAGIALMECQALAQDHPEAGVRDEVFYYVTAPISRRAPLPEAAPGREATALRTRIALAAHDLDALSTADSTTLHAFLAVLVDLHRQYAELRATTTDPNGAPHATDGPCTATWRRVPVNRNRPELGTTTEFGHRQCGESGTVDRFVKAAQGTYFIPVYACPAHRR
jgi:hypothetical protein